MMTPKSPVLDRFIGRHGDAWRLYVAPTSWKPEVLRRRMDARGEIFPVAAPDLAALDRLMWRADAPFERRPTADGGLESSRSRQGAADCSRGARSSREMNRGVSRRCGRLSPLVGRSSDRGSR